MKVTPTQGICRHCKKAFAGRSDKKFCNGTCRSAFHNRIMKAKKASLAIRYKLRIQIQNWQDPTVKPVAEPISYKPMFLRYITMKGI